MDLIWLFLEPLDFKLVTPLGVKQFCWPSYSKLPSKVTDDILLFWSEESKLYSVKILRDMVFAVTPVDVTSVELEPG